MELSKQVVSLELSKKLKELGVKQESLNYHIVSKNFAKGSIEDHKEDFSNEPELEVEQYSAFTVAELGEILPSVILDGIWQLYLYCWKDDAGKHRVCYREWGDARDYQVDKCDTEADARALMLIHLLENKLITL